MLLFSDSVAKTHMSLHIAVKYMHSLSKDTTQNNHTIRVVNSTPVPGTILYPFEHYFDLTKLLAP